MRLRSAPGLASILALLGAAPTPQGHVRHAPGSVTETYETVKVAPGVYAFVAPTTYGAIVTGNSLLVIGDSAALVVDAGHFPTLTRRQIADIRRLTSRPVRYLVNTHWHPDHWVGNAEYRRAFPQIDIISTAATRREMERQGADYLAKYHDTLLIGRLRDQARPPAAGDTSRAAAVRSAYYTATLADLEGAVRSWRDARLELPNITFENEMWLDLGHREVVVRWLGRGNTAGDAIVFLPSERVLATGDLLVAPVPYAFGSFFPDWVTTLRRLAALEPTTIVPGHGPVQRDTSYLHLVTELVTFVRDQAEGAVLRGDPPERLKTIDLSAYERRFAANDPNIQDLFWLDWQSAGLRRAYDEAKVNLER